MDFDDIVKIVDQVKVLEARLAAVEAERDAALAKRDAARAEVAHMKREQQAMIMQHRHDIRDLGQLLQDERCKVATVEAAWYTSQAGEARAVEACQRIEEALQGTDFADHGLDSPVWNALELVRDVTADKPALAWLAQQRREAAATELERVAGECHDFWSLFALRDWLRTRAAALRAGEVGNE